MNRFNYFYKNIVLTIILVMIVTGCQVNEENNHKNLLNDELLTDETQKMFSSNVMPILGDKTTTEITEVLNEDDLYIASFLNFNDEVEKVGLMLAARKNEDFIYSDFTYGVLKKQEPFELINYVGNINMPANNKVAITLGYANDPDISYIYIYYDNGKMTAISLGEKQKTFTEVNFDGEAKILRVIALSNTSEIIHEVIN